MHSRLIQLLALCALVPALLGNTLEVRPVVVIAGDSLPLLVNSPIWAGGEWKPWAFQCSAWPVCYSRLIADARLEVLEVATVALGGTTLEQWDPNFGPTDVDLYARIPNANVVVFHVGLNDALNPLQRPGGPMQPPEFESRLGELADVASDRGVSRVVLVTTPLAPVFAGTEHEALLLDYAASTRSVCAARPAFCRLLDLEAELAPAEVFDWLGVHFSPEGHAIVAARYLELLDDIFE